MTNTRTDFYRCYRLERLAARREVGYDPEYGLVVNLRRDGVMVRLSLQGESPEAYMAAYRVVHCGREEALPTTFGTVVDALAQIRSTDPNDQWAALFGPRSATEALRCARDDARAAAVVASTPSDCGPIADVNAVSNLRLNLRISALKNEYTYSATSRQSEIAREIEALESEVSRRYRATPVDLAL